MNKPTETQDPQKAAALALSKKTKRAALLFSGLLVVIVLIGLIIRSMMPALSGDPNQMLDQALKAAGGSLSLDFEETRQLPASTGLSEWLEDFPEPQRVHSVEIHYKALYVLDGSGDWDISLSPSEQDTMIVRVPVPEFRGVHLVPGSLKVEATPALSDEDRQLADDILEEKFLPLARQEENSRRTERLQACKIKVREWITGLLKKYRQPIPANIDVRFANESTETDEEP